MLQIEFLGCFKDVRLINLNGVCIVSNKAGISCVLLMIDRRLLMLPEILALSGYFPIVIQPSLPIIRLSRAVVVDMGHTNRE